MPRLKTAPTPIEPELPELEIVGLLRDYEESRRLDLAARAAQGDPTAKRKLRRLRETDRRRERAQRKEEARRAALTPGQRAAEDRSWEKAIEEAFAARSARLQAKAAKKVERDRAARAEWIATARAEQEKTTGKPKSSAREASEPKPRRRPRMSYSTSFVD